MIHLGIQVHAITKCQSITVYIMEIYVYKWVVALVYRVRRVGWCYQWRVRQVSEKSV